MPPCEGGYKEFRLGDLFSSTNGDTDIKKEHLNGLGDFVISSGESANGIVGSSDIPAKVFALNTLTIDMFGNAYFHPYKYKIVTHARVFSLSSLGFSFTTQSGLYFVSILKFLKHLFSYNNMCSWEKIKDLQISLPVKNSTKEATCDNIDFQFMESRIRELEEERVRELEVYLSAAGFANCNLTPEEEDALRKFSNGQIIFKKHTIGKLFEKLQIKTTFNKKTDVSSFPKGTHSIPLVNAKHGNNGIMFYGDKNIFSAYEMTLDIVQNGAVATGDVYAQPQPTGVLWDAYLIKNIKHNDTEDSLLFFATIIQKTIKLKYSYDKKATWERVQCDNIDLPITSSGAIDYAFMGTYISAIKKQIFQQLKDFIAKEHAAYQQVINA